MAKFKQNNVELRDNQKLIFDSAKSKFMSYDGDEVFINTTISGVEPTEDYHLGTKEYVDSAITTATGSLTTNHSDLNELDYASAGHTGFAPTSHTHDDRYYTETEEDVFHSALDDKIDTTSGTLQTQIDNIPVSVFGTEYGYSSSDAESSTSADTPQEKVTLSKTSLPSGSYHINWSYEFNVDHNKNSEFNARVQIDDTTTIAEQGEPAGKAWKTDIVWIAQSGIYNTTLSGDVDIDIDYWCADGTGVEIRRARLELWRVS